MRLLRGLPLLPEVSLLIKKSKIIEALSRLNRVKAQCQLGRDVDYLRALCFLNEQQPIAAIEALKEELRLFPDNQPAAQLLERLVDKHYTPCSIEAQTSGKFLTSFVLT